MQFQYTPFVAIRDFASIMILRSQAASLLCRLLDDFMREIRARVIDSAPLRDRPVFTLVLSPTTANTTLAQDLKRQGIRDRKLEDRRRRRTIAFRLTRGPKPSHRKCKPPQRPYLKEAELCTTIALLEQKVADRQVAEMSCSKMQRRFRNWRGRRRGSRMRNAKLTH